MGSKPYPAVFAWHFGLRKRLGAITGVGIFEGCLITKTFSRRVEIYHLCHTLLSKRSGLNRARAQILSSQRQGLTTARLCLKGWLVASQPPKKKDFSSNKATVNRSCYSLIRSNMGGTFFLLLLCFNCTFSLLLILVDG